MDSDLLTYHMKRNGQTRQDVSAALGISLKSLNNKMAGHTEFKASEILKINSLCKLSPDELVRIFFS